MRLPVYRRADLSRTLAIAAVPSLPAARRAVAWPFGAADYQIQDDPTLAALHKRLVTERSAEIRGSLELCGFAGLALFDSAARSQRGAATAEPTESINGLW
jgi:hypothetical protein